MSISPTRRPFHVFVGLTLLLATCFAAWTALVFHGAAIGALDDRVFDQFAHERDRQPPALRGLMIVVTNCGGTVANFLLAIAGAGWMWTHHRRRFAMAWLLIAIVSGVMIFSLKHVFGRERPPHDRRDVVLTEHNPSYPSGHALGSFVGYAMLGFALGQRWKGARRFILAVGLMTWVGLIGLSRVYLGAHWLSDVIGGWLLAAAYLAACLSAYFYRPHYETPEPRERPGSAIR